MDRYSLELLAYIEKKGTGKYAIRDISDALRISGKVILDRISTLVALGAIIQNGNLLEITNKGLQCLEPYRVKSAVIIAAGFGERLLPATADRPKPLVTVNGVRIIDTLLEALVSVGIRDITIVRGYKKERFDELLNKYPFLQFIDNDVYDSTNNISSAVAAYNNIKAGYFCEADLYITNPAVIKKYQFRSNILGSYSLETDDWSFKMDNDGCLCEYQKGNTYCWNYYGLTYWTAEDSAKLREDFKQVYEQEKDGKNYFWEFVPFVLRKNRYRVEIRPCAKNDIMEIDNYRELADLDVSYKL